MDSSEIAGSARIHGARSNFSQTCNLLSRYLKENGSFGDLTLGFPPTSDKGSHTETMNLLSTIEKSSAKEETQIKPKAETAPLTIFYAGQVIVFNDFPAEKAREIIALASTTSSASNQHPRAASTPPLAAQSPAESAASAPNKIDRSFASSRAPLDSDLPIARKNSLARFLEKRRDRITASAPYPAAAKAPKQAEAWLGLGHRSL